VSAGEGYSSRIADSSNSFGLTPVWSDFDGDGHLDLFLANDAGRNCLYQNDGSGHFTDIGFASGVASVRMGRNRPTWASRSATV
jgi:hypothetical protein